MITQEIYNDYFNKLIIGDRAGCSKIVNNLLENNINIRDLYIHLFQRSLYEVGSLWENNKISVATEHLATSITEYLISTAYPNIFKSEHNGKRAVVTCTPGEYHQIGARMVADYFELNGWDSFFIGASTPNEDLLNFIEEKSPDVLAVSMSLGINSDNLLALLSTVTEKFPELKILLGGQGFKTADKNKFTGIKNAKILLSIDDLENTLKNFGH